MVFQPRYSRLAGCHQVSMPVAAGAGPVRLSAWAALGEAWHILLRRPLVGAAAALLFLLVSAVSALPIGPGVDDWREALIVALTVVPRIALFAAPVYVGLMACAIDSMRRGEPSLARLTTGFEQYWASALWGLLASVVLLPVWAVPVANLLLGIPLGAFAWLVTAALADRRRGPADALRFAFALFRSWALIWLYLATVLVAWSGTLFFGAGLLLTLPVAWLALGAGYRDAVYQASVTGGIPPSSVTRTPPPRLPEQRR